MLSHIDFLPVEGPVRGVRDAGSHAGLTIPVSGDGRGVEGTKGRTEGGI